MGFRAPRTKVKGAQRLRYGVQGIHGLGYGVQGPNSRMSLDERMSFCASRGSSPSRKRAIFMICRQQVLASDV